MEYALVRWILLCSLTVWKDEWPYNKQLNNLDRSVVTGNLKPRPTVLNELSLGQYGKASVCDFPVTTSLSAIK